MKTKIAILETEDAGYGADRGTAAPGPEATALSKRAVGCRRAVLRKFPAQ